MNKKVRWGIIGATSLLVIGVGLFTVNESNYSKKVEAVASEQSTNDQMVQELKKQLQKLYFDDTKTFLSKEISQEKIDLFAKKLNKYSLTSQAFNKKIKNLRKTDKKKYQFNVKKMSMLQDEEKMIQQKFKAQELMNGLFQSPYLKGATENKEVVIIDDLSAEKLNEVKKATSQEVDEKDNTKKFELTISQGLEIAQKQLEQIDKAKKMINELYKDGKVTDKATRENYESTKKEVEQIKNKKAKESFTASLKVIEAKVQEDEAYQQKLETEKQVEEAKRQAEAAAKQAQEQSQNAQHVVKDTPVTQETQPIVETPTVQPTTPSTNTTNGGGNSSSDNAGGSSTGGNAGGTSGGNTNPTPPVPEKPHALNPYTGSGTYYATYEAADRAGRSSNGIKGYRIITEFWSNGTEKYYLELY
jgi:hypothetical protein